MITHGNVLANITPLEREMHRYLKYESWVHPIRFLNLLPLSHVFGQFLGMFLPALVAGTVIFQPELKPSKLFTASTGARVGLSERASRLAILKQKLERDLEDANQIESFGKHFAMRRTNIFSTAGGCFAESAASLDGSSGRLSQGAPLSTPKRRILGPPGYAVIQGYGLIRDDVSDQRQPSI